MVMYTETAIDHFCHPRNAYAMEEANGVGQAGNPRCGDTMRLYLRIEEGRILRASFQTLGCVAAIALSSSTTELLPGMRIEDAQALQEEDYIHPLGGLPPTKRHCAAMTRRAVCAAISDYQARNTTR